MNFYESPDIKDCLEFFHIGMIFLQIITYLCTNKEVV